MPQYPDELIKSILRSTKTIAMVGASGNPIRPSYFALKYLLAKGYKIDPVNPGMAGKEILGRKVYANLTQVPGPIDMVDIFREATPHLASSPKPWKKRTGSGSRRSGCSWASSARRRPTWRARAAWP